MNIFLTKLERLVQTLHHSIAEQQACVKRLVVLIENMPTEGRPTLGV